MNIEEVLKKHELWLKDKDGGEKAELSGADLTNADLRGADLRCVDLSDADLSGADLRRADLIEVNLRDADLSGANLSDVDICNTVGNQKQIKSVFLEKWSVTYTKDILQIGCQKHTIETWWKFSDSEINKMSVNALDWWNKYKDLIRQIIERSPAI